MDGCTNVIAQKQYAALDEFIETMGDKQANLIAVLHKAQDIFGYLPPEVQLHIARKLNIPAAKVWGVVSFYSYFTTKPRGKHVINVCMGTACYVRGSAKIVQQIESQLGIKCGETTADGEFTLDSLRCVGACGLAPVMIIDGKVYGRLTPEEVSGILKRYRPEEEQVDVQIKVS